MKFLLASTLAFCASFATAANLRNSRRDLQAVFPSYSQQCRDDAGPPFQDDAETFGGKKYHEGKPAKAVGDCPDPLKGACATKSKTAAFLEGPISCGTRGWFCRILEQPGWPAVALTSDVNFGYCNTTEGFEDAGFDKSGHCHGSDSDDTFYWWVRDHWFRGYNGHLRCCCGWDDVQAGTIVNRCDHRRLVTPDENLENCRDANEEGVSPYNGGCSETNSPALNQPIPEDDSVCWEVLNFGEPEDGNDGDSGGGGSNDAGEDENEGSGSVDENNEDEEEGSNDAGEGQDEGSGSVDENNEDEEEGSNDAGEGQGSGSIDQNNEDEEEGSNDAGEGQGSGSVDQNNEDEEDGESEDNSDNEGGDEEGDEEKESQDMSDENQDMDDEKESESQDEEGGGSQDGDAQDGDGDEEKESQDMDDENEEGDEEKESQDMEDGDEDKESQDDTESEKESEDYGIGSQDGNSEDNEEEEEEDDCQDLRPFRLNKKRKTCQWLADKANRMKRLCRKRAVWKACPKTCNKCGRGGNDKPSSSCKDDRNFVYRDTNRKCGWVKRHAKKNPAICENLSNGKLVKDSCPRACGAC